MIFIKILSVVLGIQILKFRHDYEFFQYTQIYTPLLALFQLAIDL